jgi:hypothetical protein
VYTDKEGKYIDKPVVVNTLQSLPGRAGGAAECVSVFRSYEIHPKPALKQKARGKATDTIGCIYPGTPMSGFIFDEQKATVMESHSTEGDLQIFSLAIVSLRVRSIDQCDRGYGTTIKQIRALPRLTPAVHSLFDFHFGYSDQAPVHTQTAALLALKNVAGGGRSDLQFVQQSVRKGEGDTNEVNEKPLVVVDLQRACHAQHAHVLTVGPDSKILLGFSAPGSVYDGLKFSVHVHVGVFSVGTSVRWVCDFYQWCLEARMATIVVLHDAYWMKRGALGESPSSECIIVVDEHALFKPPSAKLALPRTAWEHLQTPSEQLAVALDLSETKGDGEMRYSGWVVGGGGGAGSAGDTTHFCLMDTSKIRKPLANAEAPEGDEHHASLLCQIYPGMSSKRHVWVMYLCTMRAGRIITVIPVGAQGAAAQAPSLVQVPANVNLYADPLMLLD